MAKILLIDDDEDLRLSIKAVLMTTGHECEEAGSAVEGIQRLAEVKPDLVILDVMMEDQVAGFRVVNAMRDFDNDPQARQWEKVPILMLTSVQQVTRTRFEQDAGTPLLPVDCFVEKPIKPTALLAKVKELLA